MMTKMMMIPAAARLCEIRTIVSYCWFHSMYEVTFRPSDSPVVVPVCSWLEQYVYRPWKSWICPLLEGPGERPWTWRILEKSTEFLWCKGCSLSALIFVHCLLSWYSNSAWSIAVKWTELCNSTCYTNF